MCTKTSKLFGWNLTVLSKLKSFHLFMLLWSMKSRNPVLLIISNNLWEWLLSLNCTCREVSVSQIKKVPLVPHSFAFLCFVLVLNVNVLFLSFVHHAVPTFFKFLENVWLRDTDSVQCFWMNELKSDWKHNDRVWSVMWGCCVRTTHEALSFI